MELPDTFWQALRIVGGFAAFCVGISFIFKFIHAAFEGRVAYWSGLQPFGFLFAPITLVTPLLVHGPYDTKKSLIKERHSLLVHLLYGPLFFMLALMFMTSGADLMGLPGSQSLNFLLTLNRPDIPPCVVYNPPFSYKFPMAKKATKTVLRAVTHFRIHMDAKDSWNEFEREGKNVDEYSRTGGPLDQWLYEDKDEEQQHIAPASNITSEPATTNTAKGAAKAGSAKHK